MGIETHDLLHGVRRLRRFVASVPPLDEPPHAVRREGRRRTTGGGGGSSGFACGPGGIDGDNDGRCNE